MRNNSTGFSRIGRVVAVIGTSLGLMFVATTPAQALNVPWPTVPEKYQPVVTVAAGATLVGIGIAGSVLALPVVGTVGAAYGASAGLAFLATGASLTYNYIEGNFPETDVNAEWVSYPTYATNGVSYSINHPSIHPNGLTSWSWRLGLYKASGALAYTSFGSNLGSTFTGTTGCSATATDPCVGVFVQYKVKTATGTDTWITALSKTITNAPAVTTPVETALPPKYGFIKDPDAPKNKRPRTDTTCNGVVTTQYGITTTGTVLVAPAGTRCSDGSLPDKVTITTEEQTDGVNWYKPLQPTDVATCGSVVPAQSIQCVAGGVVEFTTPTTATSPSDPHAACFDGTTTCNTKIEKETSTGAWDDCSIKACPGFSTVQQGVESGTGPSYEESGYRCTFHGETIPVTECDSNASVLVNPDLQANTDPTYNTDACGFSLSCYFEAYFTPNQTATQNRINQLQVAFNATPFGVLPGFVSDFTSPFSVNVFAPNEENCAGPTLTLPRNMGVDGTGVTGNYVIQPLYACEDTDMGKFGKDISTRVRGFLAPTVYVTGFFIIMNTILGAMGLALPMFVRGMEIDESTGEVLSGNRWRVKNSSSRRIGPKQWRNTR